MRSVYSWSLNMLSMTFSYPIIFEFTDIQSIIHFHAHARAMTPIPQSTLRSILYQLVRAMTYMHQVGLFIAFANIELDPPSRFETRKYHGHRRWLCKSRRSRSRKNIL
jgi:hypothetical protein